MNEYVDNVVNLSFRVNRISKEERDYTINGYNTETKRELETVATKKKILPVVGKLLMDLGIDSEFWHAKYSYYMSKNKAIIELIDGLFHTFKSEGVERICVYENFGALLSSGNDIALFASGDVDLLADSLEKEKINLALAECGFHPSPSEKIERYVVTEYLKNDSPIRINVAWRPLLRFAIPITMSYEQCDIWSSLVEYENSEIKLPSANVLLYLCLLRIAVHGYSRSPDVRLYIDVYNALCTNPDWNTVLKWAVNDRVITKVLAVSYIAHRLNGVPVPQRVIDSATRDKYVKKVVSISYDEENRKLRYDPTGLTLLKLEAASDRKSLLQEVLNIIFPPCAWVADFYTTPGEGIRKGYVNYYRQLVSR